MVQVKTFWIWNSQKLKSISYTEEAKSCGY